MLSTRGLLIHPFFLARKIFSISAIYEILALSRARILYVHNVSIVGTSYCHLHRNEAGMQPWGPHLESSKDHSDETTKRYKTGFGDFFEESQ